MSSLVLSLCCRAKLMQLLWVCHNNSPSLEYLETFRASLWRTLVQCNHNWYKWWKYKCIVWIVINQNYPLMVTVSLSFNMFSIADTLTVMCSYDVLFRLLDVGVTKQKRRGAPTSALRPGVVLTNSERHGINMNTNMCTCMDCTT